MKKRITHDFETQSKSNLKKEAAYKYSLDPSTRPTCLAFKKHGEKKIYFLDYYAVNRPWAEQPERLKKLWCGWIEDEYEFSAHNSFFERCIYDNILVKRYGWPPIPQRLRRCTAAKAAACALPRNLEGAGEAMRLSIQKDKRGYNAMMLTCKPTRAWNAWKKANEELLQGKKLGAKKRAIAAAPEPKVFITPEDAPDVYEVLYQYCKIDVRAEEELDDVLPDLIPSELELWHYNQALNWRGLAVDIETVQKVVGIMEADKKIKLKELDKLTMGLVTKPGAVKSILEFLALDGINLPDMRASTVKDNLDGFILTEDGRRLLEIRKALSLSSTKKYYSFLNRMNTDGRVRDLTLYHGASTGRDTGTGIQIHNFPRGLMKVDKARPYATVENVVECDTEMLKILYGPDLGLVFSAILRNLILPSKGCELFVADFSKIEVAVCWFLADNVPGLKILREGKDPYKYQAAQNTGKKYEEIEEDSLDRQLGKAQILGCQFGMGPPKFKSTAWDMHRLKLTDEQARDAVYNYRAANPAVPAMWKAVEKAAVGAVENGGFWYVNKCKFFCENNFLWIELPSGRRLAYREPQIAWRETEYGPRKTLEFMGLDKSKKKLALERTWGGTLTENIVQATARDLMMPALLRLEKRGYRGLFAVHDEGICERQIGGGDLEEFVKILCEPPKWAMGMPIEAKGWRGPRYRK